MNDDELTDLFRTASGAIGPHPEADPSTLISRARHVRHRQRMVGLAGFVALVMLGAMIAPSIADSDGGAAITVAAGTASGDFQSGTGDSLGLPALEETTTTMAPLVTAPPPPPPPTSAPPDMPAPTVAPTTKPPVQPVTPTTARPTTTEAPSTSKPPGVAPQFVSATGDLAAGRVTVRFNRPVIGGDVGGNGAGNSGSYLAAMRLIVFGADASCSMPQGNAHEYLAGVGTDTITVDATSLAAGTTYILIGEGFVRDAADGTTFSAAAAPPNGKPAGFGGICFPIPVSG